MPEPEQTGSLQFERAEFAQPPSDATCTTCQKAIATCYYEVNGQVVCSVCRDELARAGSRGSRTSRFLRALFAGSAAGAVGSLIYFAISKLTGYEFGLVAIIVGVAVGAAVRWGCYGRGGRGYQALAVVITYLAIVSTHVPAVIEALDKSDQPAVAPVTLVGFVLGVTALVLIACAAPFFAGIQNILGLLIIGFGLWEAWKMNRRPVFAVTGPHALAPSTPPPLAGV